MQHTAAGGVLRLCWGGVQGVALVLFQQGDHALRQMVGVGDVLGGQAGVFAGDQKADVLLLQHFQPAGRIPPACGAQHEHGVEIARNRQIQDLQGPMLGVLFLVLRFGHGDALLFHIGAVADQDAVVVAPGRKAEAVVGLQILDGVEDVGAVLNDLTEQAAQGLAALVQDAGRIEDGAVDAAPLEDADVLQIHAVRSEKLVGVHLHGVHAAQFFDRGPAGNDRTGSGGALLQPQGGQTGHQRGGERGTHAEHGGHGRSHAVEPAAEQQEHQTAEHCSSQQDVRRLAGAALTGALAKALFQQGVVPLDRAAEQDPGVLFVQTAGKHPDQVLVPDPERPLQSGRVFGGQVVAVFHSGQLHPAAQQGHEQPQRRDAGQQRPAGRLVAPGVEQGDGGFQRRTAGGQCRHGVCTGAAVFFQAAQTVPQDGVGHGQRCGQHQQVGGVECRRSDDRVQRGNGCQQARRRQPEVEQHHSQDAAEHTAQREFCAHLMQFLAHGFRGRLFGSFLCWGRRRLGCGCVAGRGFCSRFRRLGSFGGRGIRCGDRRFRFLLKAHQRDAHAVVHAGRRLPRGGRRRGFVVALPKEAEGLGQLRSSLFRLRPAGPVLGEDHLRQDRAGLFLSLQCGSLDAQHLLRGGRVCFGPGRFRGREEQGLELLHLGMFLLLLRGQRAAHIVLLIFRLLRLRSGLLFGGRLPLGRGGRGRLHRRFRLLCHKEVCGQFQIRLRLSGLVLPAQPDLTRRRKLLGRCRFFGGWLCLLLGAAQDAAQDATLGLLLCRLLLFVVPALHLIGHLRHTGAEKGAEFFFLGCEVLRVRFLKAVFTGIILRHSLYLPAQSLRSSPRLFACSLALDLIQNDASRHRDVEAVHASALCGHIQPHHAIAELFHQLRDTAALAAQHQRDGAGEVIFAQGHTVHIGTVDENALVLQAADGLADVGHTGHGQALRSTGAGFDDGGGHGSAAPLGDDDAMSTAEQCTAHHRTQIVGVFDAVAQHKERRLPLRLGRCQQVFHRGILDLAGKRSHTLVALGAGHQAELVGVDPLDGGPCLLGHGGEVRRHSGGHALGQQHRIHAGAALEQLGHGVLAVDQALILRCVLRSAAGAARHFLFVHCVLLPFIEKGQALLFHRLRNSTDCHSKV